MVKKNKKYKWNLRRYIAIVSICTLLYALIISSIPVIVGVKVFYSGEVTYNILIILSLIVVIIAMIIGGIFIWFGTGHLTRPLLEVNDAVKQVAEGNFKVKINRKERDYGKYEYSNEIDELSKNVNKMVAELDSMDYMRKDFMSSVSHEIKTPIAAITGFTEILLDGRISEREQQEYLKVINEESMRISRLCENMLCMARLDSQVIIGKKEKIQLDEQIRKCIILLSEKWSSYEIDFEIDLAKIEIISDSDMLHHIWINLIDNAIKYSGENCKISISAQEVNDNIVEVKIMDQGIGINENKVDKIFEKFYQCDESHKKSGNGLGLSIVKRIIELLNGEVKCESKEGVGTTMIVRFKKEAL